MFSKCRLLTIGVGGCLITGFCYYSSTNKQEEPNMQSLNLKSVQVFFRHGARTPLKHITGVQDEVTYDANKCANSRSQSEVAYVVQHLHGGPQPDNPSDAKHMKILFKGGVNAGMLTMIGKEQAYQLGQRLAKSYRVEKKFIGSDFSSREILVRSTNVQRCIESMRCVVSGLFGVESFAKKPLVIPVEEIQDDILFPNHNNCDLFQEMSNFSENQFMKTAHFTKIVQMVQARTGDTRSIDQFEFTEIMHLRDHYVARKTHGLVVPEFLEKLKDQIDQAAVLALSHHLCCSKVDWKEFVEKNKHVTGLESMDLQRTGISLAMGQTWHLITENMRKAADRSQESPKLYLYACHDSSLVPLLLAMGCYDNQWPPYAADIAFETYEDAEQHQWVKVSYCGKVCSVTLVKKRKPRLHTER